MAHHANFLPYGGIAGVNLFFILSGYLITRILVRDLDADEFSFRRFYARRARRLLPALFLMILGSALIYPQGWWEKSWPALLYVANYVGMERNLDYMAHTWTLAVEEHFYLIWPVVIFLVPAAHRLKTVLGLGLASVAWRVFLYSQGNVELFHWGTGANAAAILAGCALAVSNWQPPRVGWLEVAWLRWFGTISYGLYLWHPPLMKLVDQRWMMVPVAVGVAWCSWRLVEQPILSSQADKVFRANTAPGLGEQQPLSRLTRRR